MTIDQSPFEWTNGVAHFRGLRVQHRIVTAVGRRFEIACLEDAADLLDEPDFAKPFLEEDRAPYGFGRQRSCSPNTFFEMNRGEVGRQ